MKRLITLIAFLAIAAMAFASVPSHHKMNFDHAYAIQKTVLQPGTYKVVIDGAHATITQKHQTLVSDLTVETAPRKFRHNAFVSREGAKERELVAIEIGGTHYRVVVK